MNTKTFNTQRVLVSDFGGPEVLKIVDETIESSPEKGLLIEVWAVGVGYADIMAQRGGYFLAPKRPFSPGYDLVGRVADSYNSNKFKEGDLIAAMLPVMCTYQDKLQVPEKYLIKLPENIKVIDAVASILNYLTAYCILEEKAKVKEGDKVLIHGVSGGVGMALAQIGQLKKLKMYGTCSASKFQLAEKFGVIPIDYKNEVFEAIIKKKNPSGINAAFDAMGAENLKRTAKVIKRGGTIVSYGFSGSNYGGYAELFKGLLQFLKIKLLPNGIKMKACGTPSEVKKKPEWYRKTLSTILSQIKDWKINPLIDSTFPLTEVAKAHAFMESGKAKGKVVLTTKYFKD